MAAFQKLRHLVDDAPELIVCEAQQDMSLLEVCDKVSSAAGALRRGERTRRELYVSSANPAFAMEKRRPTYDLDAIKLAIGSVETLAMTSSALRNAVGLGFDRTGVVETIISIEHRMFYKSMTTLADHRVWQDVYHVPARGLTLYVKFQADVVTEFTVMSFKEK